MLLCIRSGSSAPEPAGRPPACPPDVKTEIPIEILHRRLQEKGSCVKCKPLRIKVPGIRPSSWSHGTPPVEQCRGSSRASARSCGALTHAELQEPQGDEKMPHSLYVCLQDEDKVA